MADRVTESELDGSSLPEDAIDYGHLAWSQSSGFVYKRVPEDAVISAPGATVLDLPRETR